MTRVEPVKDLGGNLYGEGFVMLQTWRPTFREINYGRGDNPKVPCWQRWRCNWLEDGTYMGAAGGRNVHSYACTPRLT